MTDREKALIILQNCLDYENGEKSIYPMIPIEIYRKVLKTAVEALKEQKSHGEWIPCSERLPEKSGQYYVSGGDKVWICDFLIVPTFKGGWCNNVSNPVVEAWMPLPEPYKEEGDEE